MTLTGTASGDILLACAMAICFGLGWIAGGQR
jgi:hypothetical protein